MELLREGVVYVNEASIGFCRQAEAMEEAEESAKQNKKGYWKNYVVPSKVSTLSSDDDQPKELVVTGEMNLTITSVMSGDSFYAIAETDQSMLNTVETALRALPIPVEFEDFFHTQNNLAAIQPVKGGVYGCLIGTEAERRWVRVYLIVST